ncbi:hypothetical protein STEG23_017689, partial [Scotinomys teguina]
MLDASLHSKPQIYSHGFGDRYGVEEDKWDKAALGYDYKGTSFFKLGKFSFNDFVEYIFCAFELVFFSFFPHYFWGPYSSSSQKRRTVLVYQVICMKYKSTSDEKDFWGYEIW